MNIRDALKGLIVPAVLAGAVVSCGSDDDSTTAATVVRTASLTVAQEVPAVTTPAPNAAGRGAVVVNPTTLEITGGITFTGLTGNPTAAHIHPGAAGATGNPIITLTIASDNATATVPPGTALLPAQYTALLAGELYFNVHTALNGNGEIRGQITGQGGVIAGLATLNGAQEVPSVTTTATGRGTIVVDSTTNPTRGDILIAYVTHDVTGANNAHIHFGAPGTPLSSGGIAVGLNPPATNSTVYTAPQGASLLVPVDHLPNLTTGYLYFNVHSATNTGGEIRGQIAVQ